jgi:hypothetical protein
MADKYVRYALADPEKSKEISFQKAHLLDISSDGLQFRPDKKNQGILASLLRRRPIEEDDIFLFTIDLERCAKPLTVVGQVKHITNPRDKRACRVGVQFLTTKLLDSARLRKLAAN